MFVCIKIYSIYKGSPDSSLSEGNQGCVDTTYVCCLNTYTPHR